MAMEDDISMITAWLDQEDRRVVDCVRAYGCYIQAIGADGDEPGFAYTIGLFGLSHPELLVFGLDLDSASFVLNSIFTRIAGGGDLTPGEVIELEDCNTRFFVETLPNPGEILYSANRYYQRPPEASVPAYQLTWDLKGTFPWDQVHPYDDGRQPRPGTFGPV